MCRWWLVRRVAGLGCVIGALGMPPGLLAQEIPSVTSTSHLAEVVGHAWTNDPAAKLFPPGTEFELNVGAIAFENTFETNLLNSLIPVTNETVVLYPVTVIETNLPSRQRIYFNADEVAVLTAEVNDENYPNAWIEHAYGQPPGYLSGTELDAWYAERDPARCTQVFSLLSTSSVPAYAAMMTNGVSELISTQSWEDLLILYSNDIAAVGILEAAGSVGVYLHAPTNTSLLDVFSSPDLLDTNAWMHRGVYAHTVNPTLFIDGTGGTQLVYTAADALADEDGDLLSTGRETFLYHTSSTTNDTDGDGLTDGQEILTYGLNALRADSDGDGLDDAQELLLGADPWARDTDLDWASDGYEVDQGTSPTDAAETPALWVAIDGGAFYATSSVLTLTFPGLVADRVAVSEQDDLSGALVHDPELPVPLVLAGTSQGLHTVHAQAFRGELPLEEAGPYLSGSVVLDTEPPLLSVTEPLASAVVHVPGVDIRGTVSDASDTVRVWVNNLRVDGIEQGAFRFLGFPLEPGTNELTVLAADLAGNTTQVTVSVDHDWTGDTNAPVFSLGIEQDTRVGNVDFLDIVGSTDDDYADVYYTITTDGGQTNGPYNARSLQGQLLTRAPLQPGTNVVDVTATDAAGNQSTARSTIVRDPDVDFRFTSPEGYSVRNGGSITVSGVAPASFMSATVTVNDIEVPLSPSGTQAVFAAAVELGPGLNLIEARAVEADGGTWVARLQASGYEILSYRAHHQEEKTACIERYDDGGYLRYGGSSGWEGDWRLTNATHVAVHQWSDWWESYDPPDDHDSDSSAGGTTNTEANVTAPPDMAYFGNSVYETAQGTDASIGVVGGSCSIKLDGDTQYRFRKFDPEDERQLVVMHFKNLSHQRNDGEPLDPSRIEFFGEPGFQYGADEIGFLFEMEMGKVYTIDRNAFSWPEYDIPLTHPDPNVTARQNGRSMSFDEFGNAKITMSMLEPDDHANRTYYHYKFDAGSTGVCVIPLTVSISPDTDQIRDMLANHVTWGTEVISGTTRTYQNGLYGPGIGIYANGHWEEFVEFSGLPEQNSSFGKKRVWAKIQGETKSKTIYGKFVVFFTRSARNHPGPDSGQTANWHYYWQQGAVGGGLGDFTYSALSNVRGYYDPQFDELVITELAVQSKQAFLVTNKFDSSIVVEIGVDADGGIESVASTVLHERMHRSLYQAIAAGAPDLDGDYVPDSSEPQYNLNVGAKDTYEIFSRFPSSNYHKYGDSEFLCRLEEMNFSVSKEEDWAMPGEQWTDGRTGY